MPARKSRAERAQDSAVGFIGIGRMGAPLTRRLVSGGFPVLAWDNDPAARRRARAAGADVAACARDVADRCRVVMVCLPTPAIVREVALGADGLCCGNAIEVYVDLSTCGTDTASAVAEGLAAHGIVAVDSPVTGGVSRATDGTLAVIVSGPPTAVRRARPLLDRFGTVHVVGRSAGQAQTLKVINNLLGAVALVASSEAFVMGVKAGLDPDAMLAVINSGSGRNSATLDKFPRSVLTRRFDFGFPVSLYCKDIHLGLAEAERLGVSQFMGTLAAQFYDHARHRGGGADDFTSIIRVFEDMAGVQVAGAGVKRRRRAP